MRVENWRAMKSVRPGLATRREMTRIFGAPKFDFRVKVTNGVKEVQFKPVGDKEWPK